MSTFQICSVALHLHTVYITFHLQQLVRLYIAKSRMEIDQARMLVLDAASAVDRVGGKAARKEVWQHVFLVPT